MPGLPQNAFSRRLPMSTGEALATLPTSSSDCIMRFIRACRLALALMPLFDMATRCQQPTSSWLLLLLPACPAARAACR